MTVDNFKQHEFNAEWVEDKSGPAIMLTQSDGYCEPQTVLVHPWQFRAVCEHFGILPTGGDQARRTIATLTRRLQALTDRIADLRLYVANHSDHEHADLHVEMVMLNALGDLANEWAQEAEPVAIQADDGKTADGTLEPAPTLSVPRARRVPEPARSEKKAGAKGQGASASENGSKGQGALI